MKNFGTVKTFDVAQGHGQIKPEAGGDLFHSGGRQFDSKSDPDYQVLMQWVGVTANSGGPGK